MTAPSDPDSDDGPRELRPAVLLLAIFVSWLPWIALAVIWFGRGK